MNFFAFTYPWSAALAGALMVLLAGTLSYYVRPFLGRWTLSRIIQRHPSELLSLRRTIAETCSESLGLSHMLEALSPELLALDSIRAPGMNAKGIIDDTFLRCRDKQWPRQPRFIRNRLYSSAQRRLINVLVDIFETFNDTLIAHTNTHQWFAETSKTLDVASWISHLPTYFGNDFRFWWHLTLLTLLGGCIGLAGPEHKLAWLLLMGVTTIAVFQSPLRDRVNWFQLVCHDLTPKGEFFFRSDQNTALLNKVLQRRCDSLLGARERTTLQLLLGPFQYHIWRQHLQSALFEQIREALSNHSMVFTHNERIEQSVPPKTREHLNHRINTFVLRESSKYEQKAALIILILFGGLSAILWW